MTLSKDETNLDGLSQIFISNADDFASGNPVSCRTKTVSFCGTNFNVDEAEYVEKNFSRIRSEFCLENA